MQENGMFTPTLSSGNGETMSQSCQKQEVGLMWFRGGVLALHTKRPGSVPCA